MATNFPTSLDTYTARVDGVDNVVAADVNDPHDAVVAIETKLGVNGSAVTTTIDYKVTQLIAGTGMSGSSQATAFIPTGSTTPTNGIFLPAANVVGIATNSTGRTYVSSTGTLGHTGGALISNATYGRLAFATNLSTGRLTTDAGNEMISIHSYFDATVLELSAGSSALNRTGLVIGGGASTSHANVLRAYTNDTERLRIASNGNVTLFAVTAGYHTILGNTSDGNVFQFQGQDRGWYIRQTTGGGFDFYDGFRSAVALSIDGSGYLNVGGGSGYLKIGGNITRFESVETAVPTNTFSNTTASHGGPRKPDIFKVVLRCKTAELGYSIGDEVGVTDDADGSTSGSNQSWASATQIGILITRTTSNPPVIRRKDTGASATITAANWVLVFYALWL